MNRRKSGGSKINPNSLQIRSLLLTDGEDDSLNDFDNFEDSRMELRTSGHNLVY